jgi:hypothetical protein
MSDGPSRQAAPVGSASAPTLWRRLDRRERRTLRLLTFGLLVAIPGVYELATVHPAPWHILGTRSQGLDQTLTVLERGGPVLTSVLPSGALYRAGGGDDQGLYLFIPWLADALGWEDPVNLLRWVALLAFGVAVALYPWMIRELSGSLLAAVASPFLLLIGLWLLPLADIYWVAAWVIVALLPLLLLLDRRWPRYGLAVLLGLLVLASVASSIRSQAGLAILLGAALIVAARPWSRWSRAGALALCLIAYLSVSTFGMAAARAERERALDGRTVSGDTGDGHPFWHTAYIGLGYLPNKWDIRYYDGVAYRDVLREEPKARYLGRAYGRILRDRYFDLVVSDPVFAVKDYGAKLLVSLRPATPLLVALALFLPWLLLVDGQRARWRRDALFVGLAALIAIASPLLATPDSAYLVGWLGAVLLAGLLAGAAIFGRWTASRSTAPRSRVARAGAGGRLVALSALGAVTAVVIGLLIAPSIQSTADRWRTEVPPPRVSQPADANR